ncbi:MAG: hypothetical protein ACOC8F_04010 [Planctomycetota bacterium]
MGRVLRFLRDHPYRRLLTVSLTVAIAAAGGVLLYPWAKQRWVIHRLGSADDPAAFRRAVIKARNIVDPSPVLLDALSDALLRRLDSADPAVRRFARAQTAELCSRPAMAARFRRVLDDADGATFLAVALALRDAGALERGVLRPERRDRLRALEAETAPDRLKPYDAPLRRRELLAEAVIDGRDNRHVRRLLDICVRAENWTVRRDSALLAGRVGADATLEELLDDAEPAVVAAAARAVGAARRDGLYELLADRVTHTSADVAGSAAWAAARLHPQRTARRVAGALSDAAGGASAATRRDVLLDVAGRIGTGDAREAVLARLARARHSDTYPSAAALLAAGRCTLSSEQRGAVLSDVRATLTAARDGTCSMLQMLAALETSRRLEADVLDAIVTLLAGVRNPAEVEPLLTAACRRTAPLLAARPADDPLRRRATELLAGWADYYDPEVRAGTDYLTCPVASAAAAAVLWRVGEDNGDLLRRTIGGGTPLGADVATWIAARARPDAALELGLAMLPASDAPPQRQVHNPRQRAAGALLLELATAVSTPDERPDRRAAAVARLRGRLSAGRAWGEPDADVRRAMRGALAAVGAADMLSAAREAFTRHPGRRTLTALLLAGDRWALDTLLIRPRFTDGQVDAMLTDRHAGEVLSSLTEHLPAVDAGARTPVRLWQVRVLRAVYAVSRGDVEVGP